MPFWNDWKSTECIFCFGRFDIAESLLKHSSGAARPNFTWEKISNRLCTDEIVSVQDNLTNLISSNVASFRSLLLRCYERLHGLEGRYAQLPTHLTPEQVECYFCAQVLDVDKIEDYMGYLVTHLDKEQSYECKSCRMSFGSKRELCHHRKDHRRHAALVYVRTLTLDLQIMRTQMLTKVLKNEPRPERQYARFNFNCKERIYSEIWFVLRDGFDTFHHDRLITS
jgi:hypothetical protein